MKPDQDKIQILQEQLILLYRFLNQRRVFKEFFGEELPYNPKKDKKGVINKLLELDGAEYVIKECIIELEELKSRETPVKTTIGEILESYDLGELKRKYGMKTSDDLEKLDLELLMEYF